MTHPGLCAGCSHARIVENDRGSRFWLCRAASWHPALRKYPGLPVLQCPAFTPGTPAPAGRPDDDASTDAPDSTTEA